jgi:tetratricopeptide (TPR) repeat protein
VRVERLVELSSWMMILGTIRLVCSLADYASAFLEATRSTPASLRMLSGFFQENNPLFLLCSAWPLALGAALRRTRWRELLPAAAATFLILAIGGVMEWTAEWTHSRGDWLTVGSFRLTRRAFSHPTLPEAMLVLLGTTQLLFELATAVHAGGLSVQCRGTEGTESPGHGRARRARFGRLAVYFALGYLAVTIRLPVWSAYLEVLNKSTIVREFILRNDSKQFKGSRRPAMSATDAQPWRDIEALGNGAIGAFKVEHFHEAHDSYIRLVSLVESVPENSIPPEHRLSIAHHLNNFAWLLATCPEITLRSSKDAVRYAARAVEMAPRQGTIWNTLGVSYYRAGEWEEAKNALYRSMELRNEGDSFDWFFLALVHLKLGHTERARDWYDKAVLRFDRNSPDDLELYRFQVEAAQELGLPKPALRSLSRNPRMMTPDSVQPFTILKRGRGRRVD